MEVLKSSRNLILRQTDACYNYGIRNILSVQDVIEEFRSTRLFNH